MLGKENGKELPERQEISQDDSVIAAKEGWSYNNKDNDVNSDIIGMAAASISIMPTVAQDLSYKCIIYIWPCNPHSSLMR